jgi:hypothetical protein
MLKITVDYRDVERSLEKFSKALNKSVEESVIELGQSAAYQLAYRVQPFGVSNKSKEILHKAIYKDVSKAYKTTGTTYADIKLKNPKLAAAYMKAVEANDLRAAERIVDKVLSNYTAVEATDSGDYLQSIRNQKGRVDTDKPMNLTNEGQIKSLKDKLAPRAGLVKAGFMKAGESLGWKRRVPKWLQNAIPLGSSKILRNGYKTVVTLINHVRYASNVMSDSQAQAAIKNAYNNQIRKLKKQLQALGEKF